MFGTGPVSICLYFTVRCCARQKYFNELIRRKRVLSKLGVFSLKDYNNFQSVSSFTTMRDYSNGSVKNDSLSEQNAVNDNIHVCNGR